MNDFQKYLFGTFSKCTVEEFDARVSEIKATSPEEEKDIAKMRSMLLPFTFDEFQQHLHICCPEENEEPFDAFTGFPYIVNNYKGKPFSFLESEVPTTVVFEYRDFSFEEQVSITGVASIIMDVGYNNESILVIEGVEDSYLFEEVDEDLDINPFDIDGFSVHHVDLENVIVYRLIKADKE